MICEEFKGSRKGLKKRKKKTNPKTLQGSLERRYKGTVFSIGKTAVVAGPSEVRENTVEKLLGAKRNCNLGALLLFTLSYRNNEFHSTRLP